MTDPTPTEAVEARCPECGGRKCDGARGELCGKDAKPFPPVERGGVTEQADKIARKYSEQGQQDPDRIGSTITALLSEREALIERVREWQAAARARLRDAEDQAIRADRAEAQEARLREAGECVLAAINWNGDLSISYEGEAGDVEAFEEALHELHAALSPNPERDAG